jgi:hypothetical protein
VRRVAFLVLLASATPAVALQALGVKLGADEEAVRKALPNAYCKALEWKSDAADRRCDDARAQFAGTRARVTVYLKSGVVQAVDLRLDAKDLEALKRHLRQVYGAPKVEGTEVIPRGEKGERRVYKMRWESGAERAVLTAPEASQRAELSLWRGNFDSEIYRVK